MTLSLLDLDPRVRAGALAELDDDTARGTVFISRRLTPPGAQAWPVLLQDALERGNDDTLAAAVRPFLNEMDQRISSRGKYSMAKVPYNAAETLAEGEFNRYFARGLARVAIEDGVTELEVYRAKSVSSPRPESERLIGQRLAPDRLLADLRTSKGVDTVLGVPAGPNSGLSVRIPADANRDTA